MRTLTCIAAPTREPLTLSDASIHLRSVGDIEDDQLILDLIVAARQWAETRSARALVTQTWELRLDNLGDAPGRGLTSMPGQHLFNRGAIELPKPPLQSVTSIQYTDISGNQVTWSPSLYTVSGAQAPPVLSANPPRGRIQPVYGTFWPVTLSVPEAFVIRFVCGYGTPAAVPVGIKRAILIKLGDLYQRREPTVESRFVNTRSDEDLLSSFCSQRWE